MSPNPCLWCTTKGGITTVPMLEGKLDERTCSVPSVTGLLTLIVGLRKVHSLVKQGGVCFPSLWAPKAGPSGFGLFMLLGPRESRLAYTVFSVPDVSDTVLGVRLWR